MCLLCVLHPKIRNNQNKILGQFYFTLAEIFKTDSLKVSKPQFL